MRSQRINTCFNTRPPAKGRKEPFTFRGCKKGGDLNVVYRTNRGRGALAGYRSPIQAEEEGKVLAFPIWAPNNWSTIGIGKETAMRLPGNKEAWSRMMGDSDGMILLPRAGSQTDCIRDGTPRRWAVFRLQAPGRGLRGPVTSPQPYP